ncbi:MAG: S8 family serine peptidase [Actinomycetota bacterium]|nr:S8 family serine peptidase [Actinomycetota bacterium]
MLTLLAVLAIAIGVLSPVSAGAASPTVDLGGDKTVVESQTGSYIVVMEADPLIVEFGQDGLTSKAAEKKAKGLAKGHDKALTDAGLSASDKVQGYTNALNGFSAFLSFEEAQAVANQPEVAMVLPDELMQADTDSSPTFLGLTDPAGVWQTGYDGEGVVIGVIDTGIWPEHDSFADDGSYSSPPITVGECDFGNSAHNADDADFECNNKLIGARQMLDTYRFFIGAEAFEYDSARDDNGHGTHTASTAGGNAGVDASIFGIDRGTVSGIAPRAHIVAYKGLGFLGGFGSDLAAAIDQAVADGVDVINYSIGSSSAAIGPDDIAFLFAAADGVFIATSNGNNGPGAATTGSPASVPWLTAVGASTQARTFRGSAVLGDGSEFFGASVTTGVGPLQLVDAADAGDELCNLGALNTSVVTGKIVLCKRGVIARVEKSQAVAAAGGLGMILYNASDTQSQVTDNHFVPSVHINNTDGLVVKAYIASEGAAATATITEGVFAPAQGSVMAAFSSRGPNVLSSDIIRPDVTAPGVNILAGNTPTPDSGAPGQLFQSISGTSMSSPHVAGLFALIKQANPDWSAAMAKSAIMTTARQDVTKEDATTPADLFDMGAGHVDPGKAVHKGSSFQPGLVYDAGLFEYAGFTCGADLNIFSSGSCDFLAGIGVPIDPSDLNVPSIGIGELVGSQTITRTVTSVAQESGWRTYNVSVDAPAGFDATVSPSSIRLKSGQSASYDVTFTANSAAQAGVWSYGALTWSDTTGNYDVRSPIALRGEALGAPVEVSGTGTTGSASFDVTFGYTGDYTAAPHGLVARVDTVDTISQDPDQTYPSIDDGVGVNKHTFTLTDVAVARWSLVIPGPDDIDLFLEDSSGTIVAASTNGGTDELIELLLPADGTYTMVVHGWSVPSEPLAYTLESWIVPNASMSLSVTGAPASATAGAVGTVDIAWTGLAAGTEYLGAVSHSDASGVLGLTLVSVDTN